MSKFISPGNRSLTVSLLVIILICGIIAISAWGVTSSSAKGPVGDAAPTHAYSFAVAEIAKPTYTASPTTVPPATDLPTEIPTEIQPPTAMADIVADTPVPQIAEPLDQNAIAQAPAPAPGYSGDKYILVVLSEQHMYVYEGGALIYSFVVSTGMNNATSVGKFSVLEKLPNAYGATWNIWMPDWLGIYWAGNLQNGIHALPILPNGSTLWAGYLGTPISYGCIVLDTHDAQVLYDWADVGTPVEIRW